MTRTCLWWAILGVSFVSCYSAKAQTKTSANFQRQQREQERARALATELVSGVLDVQLRQLQENKLEKLPIYDDIKSMRANIGKVVDREMQDIVEVLVQAQRANESDREKIVQDARGKIRSVVVALMAERQKLHKRMHLAKVAAQLRQLIIAETKVMNSTRLLPEESPQARERSTLLALEDQRDVTAIHFQFVDVLSDVASWEGAIGAGASKAVRLLKTLKIDQELRKVEQSLSASQFAPAEQSQQAAIRGWRALLEVIEETQGLAGSDRDALLSAASDLIKKQEKLREQTKQTTSQDSQRTEQLAQQQHELHQELGQFAEALHEFTNTQALAEQAKSSSFDAEAKLFEGLTEEAVQQQGQVIGALAEIEKRLEQAANTSVDKTSEQLAQEVKQLEQLDQALGQIRAKQAEATSHAGQNAPAAKGAEDQVAQQLQQANQAADFGTAIETRLADAQDEVAQAQASLSNAAPQMATDRTEAAQDATRAIDQAAAEVKQELADARREHLAVKVGELARAAEALERAAAAEHEIAGVAADASKSDGISASEADALVGEQARVQDIAKNIAEGVKGTAPEVSQKLATAEPQLNSVMQPLQAAKQNPGEPSKPSAEQASQAAKLAGDQLEQIAKELRSRAGESAAELANLTNAQLQPVAATRKAVESAFAAADPEQLRAEAMTPLQDALRKTQAAQIEQLRAAGKAQAADAKQMLSDLKAAMSQQQRAEKAARDFAQGRSNSPLRAATLQEEVGATVRELAQKAKDTVATELQAAADAADDAAKEMVVGSPNSAAAARHRAQEALARASQGVEKAVTEANQVPAQQPDETAQRRVSELINEAKLAAGDEAPVASESLGAALEQSRTAAAALAGKQPPIAAEAQAKTAVSLEKSAEQLQQAISGMNTKQAERATDLARTATKLASEALAVDAGAAVALEQASSAARESAPSDLSSESTNDSQDEVTRGFERATASLAAREQELQRDKDIAEAIAQLAKDQQAARDKIEDQATKLEQMAAKSADRAPAAPTPEELTAAQALADATDQFAEAQRATGEGAAEISGQEEVANQPIRKGLEAASDLGQLSQTAADPVAAQPSESEPQSTPNAPDSNELAQDQPSNELGTGFVPQSPEETARRIAGNDALEEARRALAQSRPSSTRPSEGDLSKNLDPQSAANSELPADSEPMAAQKSQSAKSGEAALGSNQQGKNEELDPSRIEQDQTAKQRDSRTQSGNEAGESQDRKFEQEPWFANLPPSLQKAIQAKSRRSPPRGYEERLKRYFESGK